MAAVEEKAEPSPVMQSPKSDEEYDIIDRGDANQEAEERKVDQKKDPAQSPSKPIQVKDPAQTPVSSEQPSKEPVKADPAKVVEDVEVSSPLSPESAVSEEELKESKENTESREAKASDDLAEVDCEPKFYHRRTITLESKVSYMSESAEGSDHEETMEEAEVQKWLQELGLHQFYPVFMQDGFDSMTRVNELSSDDLLTMGLKTGHRRIILQSLGKIPPPGCGTYRVVERQGCLVRETKETNSKQICILPQSTIINVCEIEERRARIDKPRPGWISIISTRGNVIAERTEQEAPTVYVKPETETNLKTKLPKTSRATIDPNMPAERVDIILVGETATGKTSLMRCFEGSEFNEFEQSTLGLDFRWRTLALKSRTCKVWVWDTCGQEKLRSIAKNYYRRAQGVMFVCDIHSPRDVLSWVDEVKENTMDHTEFMLLLNKIDLSDDQESCILQCSEIADECGIPSFYVTSAKTGEGVLEAFRTLTERIVSNPKLSRGPSQRLKRGRTYSSATRSRACCGDG